MRPGSAVRRLDLPATDGTLRSSRSSSRTGGKEQSYSRNKKPVASCLFSSPVAEQGTNVVDLYAVHEHLGRQNGSH